MNMKKVSKISLLSLSLLITGCGCKARGLFYNHKWVENTDIQYLIRSEGQLDLTEKATFYKSCQYCGEASKETFTSDLKVLDFAPTIKKSIEDTKLTLKFKEDGSFKILVLADPQFKKDSISPRTIALAEELVAKENPDFVMLPGDTAYDPIESTFKTFLTQLVNPMESRHIPWANTFGNHDYSGTIDPEYTPQAQMEIYRSFDYCLSRDAEPSIPGCSNYNLPILSSDGKHVAYQLWAMDTKNGGFEYQQTEWYVNTSHEIKKENGNVPINSMMFFHIPLPEMNNIYAQKDEPGFIGHAGEVPCSEAGNTDMFSAIKEVNEVRLVVNSHDHVNDFIGTYDGVTMCYCSSIGYQDYRDEDMMGARVINLNENDLTTYETHMVYAKDITHHLEPAGTSTNLEDLVNSNEDVLDAETAFTDGQYISQCWDKDETPATIEIESNKGFASSSAYKVTKGPSTKDAVNINSNLRIYLPNPVDIADNKYLRVWMDLSDVEFRKASWGVISDDNKDYNTDNNDNANPAIPMYMLFDNDTNWRNNPLGGDGCFGPGDNNVSLKGFKGFMAFNLSDMKNTSGEKLQSTAKIKGIYFYFDVKKAYRDNNVPFYFDRVALCEEYNVFKA